MFRKKKLIWWEAEPVVSGAGESRVRGSYEDSGRRRAARSPYYGPVTVRDSDEGNESLGFAGS